MRLLRRCRWLGLLALLLPGSALLAQESGPETRVELKVVTYDGMGKLINSLKGKVVVVDFWADT